jgi:hypothetical protein
MTRTLTVWPEHDEEVIAQLPARPVEVAGETPTELVTRLYRGGVRRAALDRPTDLSGATGARDLIDTMLLLAELTSWGVKVDWTVRLGPDPDIWQSFNHIHPPRAILDAAEPAEGEQDILARWRSTFYLCKCIYRRGPGFIQVRDRRGGGQLLRYTIDDPAYLSAVDQLATGCPAADIPPAILDHLVSESLAGRAGTLAWWLPYRVRRWPWPSFAV